MRRCTCCPHSRVPSAPTARLKQQQSTHHQFNFMKPKTFDVVIVNRDDSRVSSFKASMPPLAVQLLFGSNNWQMVTRVCLAQTQGPNLKTIGMASLIATGDEYVIDGLWVRIDQRRSGVALELCRTACAESIRLFSNTACIMPITSGALHLCVAAAHNGIYLNVEISPVATIMMGDGAMAIAEIGFAKR